MADRTGKRPDLEIPGTEILRVLIGSQAHGTATEDSDRDERCVFVVPTEAFFTVDNRGVSKPPQTVWVEDKESGQDLTGWELTHFCKMAINCNPTVLEVLWAPALTETLEGRQLRQLRKSFLSRLRIREAFSGYAHNQRKKMLDEPSQGWTPRNWKFGEAYIRVLYQGAYLLRTAQLPVILVGSQQKILETLKMIKMGEVGAGDIVDLAREMERDLSKAFLQSTIPDEPDISKINNWMTLLRKSRWTYG